MLPQFKKVQVIFILSTLLLVTVAGVAPSDYGGP